MIFAVQNTYIKSILEVACNGVEILAFEFFVNLRLLLFLLLVLAVFAFLSSFGEPHGLEARSLAQQDSIGHCLDLATHHEDWASR